MRTLRAGELQYNIWNGYMANAAPIVSREFYIANGQSRLLGSRATLYIKP